MGNIYTYINNDPHFIKFYCKEINPNGEDANFLEYVEIDGICVQDFLFNINKFRENEKIKFVINYSDLSILDKNDKFVDNRYYLLN